MGSKRLTRHDGLPVIALVTTSAALSGAELFLARIATYAQQYRPHVIIGESGPLSALLERGGVPFTVIPMTPAPALLAAPRWAVRVAHELVRIGAEVVYTHSAGAHVLAGIAGRLRGLPVIAHAHDLVAGGPRNRLATHVLGIAMSVLPTRIIANSRTTSASLPARAQRRVGAVLPCPVDPSDPAADRSDAPLTFGMLGRIARWKGQHVAVQAFAAARREGLPPHARLVFYGDAMFPGDEQYLSQVHELVTSLELEDAVDFAGHCTEVAAVFDSCDVMLHASITPEPFGQVIVEAMEAGRPVIAAAQGGPAEIISDGFDGILCPAGDVAAYVRAIRDLASDPRARERLGAAARQSAGRYHLDVVIPQLEDALLSTGTSDSHGF